MGGGLRRLTKENEREPVSGCDAQRRKMKGNLWGAATLNEGK